MKRTSKICAMLFCAMLWLNPVGAQQKTKSMPVLKSNSVEQKMDNQFTAERVTVAQDLKTTDLIKMISANEELKISSFLNSRPVAKAGEEGEGDGEGETSTDPILIITNPDKDTVYAETNTPTFEFSLTNAEGVTVGQQEGNAYFRVEIYELPLTGTSMPVAYGSYLSNTYKAPELPKGQYVILVALGKIVGGQPDLWRTADNKLIMAQAAFTINYGDVVPNPVLTVLEPTYDTVFEETAYPLFKLGLDKKGQEIEFDAVPGGAVIIYSIFDENDKVVESDYFFGLETHLQQPLEKGSYYAQFILGQVTSDYKLGRWPYTGSTPIYDYVEFTINYEQPDPVLTVKNPAKDTTYEETRTPTFELELAHGEGINFGAAQPGYPAILYSVYSKDSLEKYPENYDTAYVQGGYALGLTVSLTTPLPKGAYEIEFILAQITNDYHFTAWPIKGEGIVYAQADFSIDFAEPDPEFSMKNPAKDTVYAETNTPTFEVEVAHGENLVWGEEPGKSAMMVAIYTEEAYNDPQGLPMRFFVAEPTFTAQALPQGKYHAEFYLMTVSTEEGYYNYVRNLAGELIFTEVGFTIAFGATNDTMLVMKNPAKDTVYTQTNTPTFEVSVINGEDLEWGTTVGKNVVMMDLYTEEAYETDGNPMIREFLADTVFSISQPLPKGNYRATFHLMVASEKAGSYYYLINSVGRIKTSVNFTINYGDVRNPTIILIDPAKDTVYAETTTPTFTVSLDKAGNDITLDYGADNAAIMLEIYKEGITTKPLLQAFLVDTTYTVPGAKALDTGNYTVKFTLMQWVDDEYLNYWPATDRVTAQVNIRITASEKPEPMIVPTDLNVRTHQDTVWFSWTSKEEVYQLYVEDASGEVVLNRAVNADLEDTITTKQVTDFAEGSYKWKVRAVVLDEEGKILDYSNWSVERRFTVKYDEEPPVPPVSVEENLLADVNVYPNPTMGEFKVSVPVDAMVEIYAANGQRVEARTVVAGTETFTLKTSGMYFVRVTADGKTAIRRIVVR